MRNGSPIRATALAAVLLGLAGCASPTDCCSEPERIEAAQRLGKPLDEASPELARWRAAAAQEPPLRGPALGPGYRSGQLPAGRSEQLEQVFLSGKRASVALSAPSGAR